MAAVLSSASSGRNLGLRLSFRRVVLKAPLSRGVAVSRTPGLGVRETLCLLRKRVSARGHGGPSPGEGWFILPPWTGCSAFSLTWTNTEDLTLVSLLTELLLTADSLLTFEPGSDREGGRPNRGPGNPCRPTPAPNQDLLSRSPGWSAILSLSHQSCCSKMRSGAKPSASLGGGEWGSSSTTYSEYSSDVRPSAPYTSWGVNRVFRVARVRSRRRTVSPSSPEEATLLTCWGTKSTFHEILQRRSPLRVRGLD